MSVYVCDWFMAVLRTSERCSGLERNLIVAPLSAEVVIQPERCNGCKRRSVGTCWI